MQEAEARAGPGFQLTRSAPGSGDSLQPSRNGAVWAGLRARVSDIRG